jgi:hypothetical protein
MPEHFFFISLRFGFLDSLILFRSIFEILPGYLGIDYPVMMIRECNVSYVFSVPVPCPMSWILEENASSAPALFVFRSCILCFGDLQCKRRFTGEASHANFS